MNTVGNNNRLIEGNLVLKQGVGGRLEETYCWIDQTSFNVYTDESSDIELFRFESVSAWLSRTQKSEKGLFVVNDDSSSFMYFFETGNQLKLNRWLEMFKRTGWKINLVENRQYERDFYQTTRDSFDPSQLRYNSLSLSNSVNFNDIMERPTAMMNAGGQMERSSSLPSLLQINENTSTIGGGQITKTENTTQNEQNGTRSIDGEAQDQQNLLSSTSLQPQELNQPSMLRVESGYCSKESLLNLPSPTKPSKQLILTVPYTKDDLVSILVFMYY